MRICGPEYQPGSNTDLFVKNIQRLVLVQGVRAVVVLSLCCRCAGGVNGGARCRCTVPLLQPRCKLELGVKPVAGLPDAVATLIAYYILPPMAATPSSGVRGPNATLSTRPPLATSLALWAWLTGWPSRAPSPTRVHWGLFVSYVGCVDGGHHIV